MLRPGVHHQKNVQLRQPPVKGPKPVQSGIHILDGWMNLQHSSSRLGTTLQLLKGIAPSGVNRDTGNKQVRVFPGNFEEIVVGHIHIGGFSIQDSVFVITPVLPNQYRPFDRRLSKLAH